MTRPNTLCCATLLLLLFSIGHFSVSSTWAQTAKKTVAENVTTTRPVPQNAQTLISPTSEDVFHFVIYGDRTGGVPEGLKVLRQAVKDTNLIDPDLVMTVGDLIQGYSQRREWIEQMEEYKSIMAKLNMSWYPVAGNHDIYWVGKDTPQGHHESNYEEHFGPLWYSFEHKKTGFIVLYSDEGDPKTNKKGFNDFGLQMMSEGQLAFLDQSLDKLSGANQIFVFIHHPRWIGRRYTGSNWDVVHKKLSAAGNVKAVFAGHIHQMRFDKPDDDGIEYYTLATTGGHLHGDIPDAGYLHHVNMVSVRESGFSVSAIPVGAVFDPKQFTPEFLAEVDLARKARPIQTSKALAIAADGSCQGDVVLKINNRAPRTVRGTLALDTESGSGWGTTLDHQHVEIKSGQTYKAKFRVKRFSGTNEITSLPQVIFTPELVSENVTVRLPQQSVSLKLKLGELPTDFFADAVERALMVSGPDSALEVRSNDIDLPDGPMTLEAWVKPNSLSGYSAIAAKTQNSEFSIFSDEGVPQFDIHVGGRYASAKATEKLPTGQWTHVAGVFDRQHVMLFVAGKQVAKIAASGKRKQNDLSLFIGADPDKGNLPTRAFSGQIDEVRLSKTALYSATFTPKRRLAAGPDSVLMLNLDKRVGPFAIDRSSSKAVGLMGENSNLVPLQK